MSKVTEMAAHSASPGGIAAANIPEAILSPTASTDWLNTPASWLGRYVRFTFIGASPTDVAFIRWSATTAPTIALTANVVTANALAATGAQPMLTLPSGVPIDELVDVRWLFLALIASATGGKIYAQLKSGDGSPAGMGV